MNTSAIANEDDEQILVARAKATLKGGDPVIQLLDNRMRDVFRMLVIQNSQQVVGQQMPLTMRSGRSISTSRGTSASSNGNDSSFDTMFKKVARQEFVKRGFAFYSDDLAEASLLAYKTIQLILNVYGNSILEKLFISTM